MFVFFFFQAEDGIRDLTVTGVQTCALPIYMCATPLGDGPMPWKYRKSDNGATWWLGDVDVPLYRYAEAILIYAEAQNELGQTGPAIQYLNMIRARVRNGTGAQSRTEPAAYPNSGDTLGLRD